MRYFILITMLLISGAAFAAACPVPNLIGKKYPEARQFLTDHGWKVQKSSMNFDENHEITCGSAGTCWAEYYKHTQDNACNLDLRVDIIDRQALRRNDNSDENWRIVYQEKGMDRIK